MWKARGLTACFVILRYSIQRYTGEMHSEIGKPIHCLKYDVLETTL